MNNNTQQSAAREISPCCERTKTKRQKNNRDVFWRHKREQKTLMNVDCRLNQFPQRCFYVVVNNPLQLSAGTVTRSAPLRIFSLLSSSSSSETTWCARQRGVSPSQGGAAKIRSGNVQQSIPFNDSTTERNNKDIKVICSDHQVPSQGAWTNEWRKSNCRQIPNMHLFVFIVHGARWKTPKPNSCICPWSVIMAIISLRHPQLTWIERRTGGNERVD